MNILIKNIKQLIQTESDKFNLLTMRKGSEMKELEIINDAYLFLQGNKIGSFGSMKDMPYFESYNLKIIDAAEQMVFPSFCDPHTHIVYKGSREMEFVDKINGATYAEIAKKGGGILYSTQQVHQSDETELAELALIRLNEITMLGTGAVEIKSGYGLNVKDELKMLRTIKLLKKLSPLTIKATFLGAHAIPADYTNRHSEYVDLIINEMIPIVASEELADFIDVFCEEGYFSPEDTERILMAGIKHGMIPKIHANEFTYSEGIQIGVKYNALSVDHLECTSEKDIAVLKESETMPTILPGTSFFSGLPYAPARRMIDAGLPVAFASDYNPGSSPSGNMQFITSLGCIKNKLLPEEILNAVTLNSAYAMGVHDELGTIAVGKRANVFITKPMASIAFLPYSFGGNIVDTVILNGKIIK